MLKQFSRYLRTETGRIYQYLVLAGLLICASLVWQMFLPIRSVAACRPDDAATMFQITWSCGFPALETVVKVAILLLSLRYWVNPLAAILMGFANQMDMLKDQQLQDDANDSNARLNAWAVLAFGWVIMMTPYTAFWNYLANLLFRLPLTFIWAVILTYILVRYQLKITQMFEFLKTFRLPRNEAVAIWSGVGMLLAAWLVVGVR